MQFGDQGTVVGCGSTKIHGIFPNYEGDSSNAIALQWRPFLEFLYIETVGRGNFRKGLPRDVSIDLFRSLNNRMIYSIKMIKKTALTAKNMKQIIREIKIQAFLNHPNIVKLYHFMVDR